MKRILITGENGYLGKHLLEYCKRYLSDSLYKRILTYSEYLSNPNIFNICRIIHLGGVSCKTDFENVKKTSNSMIDFTLEIVELAKKHKSLLIFASSMAAEKQLDIYGTYKRMLEFYISSNLEKYRILRIPRIYSEDREKGLIQNLKDDIVPKEDYKKKIQFLDLKNFIHPFFESCFNNYRERVIHLNESKYLEFLSIKDIKGRYICENLLEV